MNLENLSSIEVLALTIYGEARGENPLGQIAIGCVIRNRVQKISYTTTYKKICLKPKQFSCWNENDSNYLVLIGLAVQEEWKEPVLLQCKFIASGIYNGKLLDVTGGADHYMTTKLYKEHPPIWSNKMKVTRVIGNHTFLKS